MLPALLLAVVVALIPGAVPLPENGRIAFATYEATTPAGLVAFAGTGGPATLLHAGHVGSLVASPNGNQVAYVVGNTWSALTLHVAGADGKGRTRIAAGWSPAWSPDGSQLVFVTADRRLAIADASGGTVRSLGVSGDKPAWSPTGEWIAFSGAGIVVIRPDGTGLTKIADGSEPVWAPTGAWLAFTATALGRSQVHVVRPDGSARRSLGDGSEPVWSPVGNRIAFMIDDGLRIQAPDGDALLTVPGAGGSAPAWSPDGSFVAAGYLSLVVIDVSDGSVTRVDGHGPSSWSPDGKRLAYVQAGALWTVEATGGSRRLVSRGVEVERDDPLFLWLRSGKLVYLRSAARPRAVILSTDANGRSPRRLASTRGSSGDYIQLTWSPDGKRLAYIRDPEESSRLEVVAADGSAGRILARGARTPSWSPDARSLAFSAARGIHLIAAAGGRERPLTRGDDRDPAWSPDARWIAFLRADGLYVIRSGGGGLRRLASGDIAALSWSPDARRIAYDIEDGAGTAIAVVGVDGKGRRYLAREEPPEENGSVVSNPRWSPDGRRILYGEEVYLCGSRCTEDFLVVVSPDGRSSSLVTESDEDYLYQAVWSPDGRRLLGQDGEGALFTLDLARKTKRKLASEWAGWATWQPLPRK